jgi:bifunctional non-homologous end joining protein LigD
VNRGPARTPLPDFIAPQLATLVSEAPSGEAWLHELKFDGFRILCRLDAGEVKLLTRSGQDWTSHFVEVARAARQLPAREAWLDGEVAVLLPDGRTSFQALQNRGDVARGQSLVYFVFDLLYLDGRDLRELPLETRKVALAKLTSRAATGSIRYADHQDGDGPALFAEACRAGL